MDAKEQEKAKTLIHCGQTAHFGTMQCHYLNFQEH